MVRSNKDEDYEEDHEFENKYEKLFGGPIKAAEEDYDLDVITGRKSKRPKMSVLNKSKVSKQELDELFLEY